MALKMKREAGIVGGRKGGGVYENYSVTTHRLFGSGTGNIWTDEPRSKLNRMEDSKQNFEMFFLLRVH